MLAGTVVIFLFGLAPLIAGADVQRAVEVVLSPFLASSGLKIALGAALMPTLWHVLGGRRAERA
jgi:biotin transporter BioY